MLKRSVLGFTFVNTFAGCITYNPSPEPCYGCATGATAENVIGSIAIVSGAAIVASIAHLTSQRRK
jgi:hypothetical protein